MSKEALPIFQAGEQLATIIPNGDLRVWVVTAEGSLDELPIVWEDTTP
jgi:hypothetical protein